MSNTMLGLDIGSSSMKLALISGHTIRDLAVEPLPENLVRDGHVLSTDALAGVLKEAMKSHGFKAKNCALVLPPDMALARRLSVPYMTVDQLLVNLPYEFHDYIQKEKDLFFYDYAVVGEEMDEDEDGDGKKLDLMAAAVRKDIIATYREVLGKAGLKLRIALPDCFTYRNLIRVYEKTHQEHPSEYGFVDLGHNAIRLHIYHGPAYETTRVIDYGGASLDALIADRLDVDLHVAANYKQTNYDNAHELDDCKDLYSRIAVELMRAVNFYGFNNPDSDLQDLYFSGGLSEISALMGVIRETLGLSLHEISELIPNASDFSIANFCPASVGVTLQ